MTDYNYWSKFNADKAAAEIDSKEKLQEFKDDKEKATRKMTKEMEVKIINSKKSSEIMQAQDAVNLLKAKGGRARRNQPSTEVVPEPISPELALSIEIANSFSGLSDSLMKLMAEVEDLEVFAEKKSRHYPGYVRALHALREIESFSEAKDKSKQLVTRIDPAEVDYRKQTESMHEELDEAHKYLYHRTARYLSLFSLSLEEYSISADMSRLVLKNSSNGRDSAATTSSAARFDGSVWVQRALSLTAMGNPYLGKLHLSSAVGGGQMIPGLEDSALMTFASELEHKHAQDYLNRSEEQRVLRELHHHLHTLLSTTSTKLRTNCDLTSISQSDIQTFLYDDEDASTTCSSASSSASSSTAASADRSGITGASDATGILSYITTLIDTNFTPSQKGMKCNLDILLARFNLLGSDNSSSSSSDECDLMVWLLVDLGSRIFYQGQILYLESMFGSALTKYYATLLLVACCLHHISNSADASVKSVSMYLNRLATSCLMSAAQCKVHKQEHRSSSSSKRNNSDGSLNNYTLPFSHLTVSQLLGMTSDDLSRRSDEMCGGRSLLVKLKRAALLEQTEDYGAALTVLLEMEQLLDSQTSIECGNTDTPAAIPGVGCGSGPSFAEHHSLGDRCVDLSFQVSQRHLLTSPVTESGSSSRSNSGLGAERWRELIRVQRSSTQYKQRKVNLV